MRLWKILSCVVLLVASAFGQAVYGANWDGPSALRSLPASSRMYLGSSNAYVDPSGNLTIQGPITTGNIGGANNTGDYIIGQIASGTTSQTAQDVVVFSATVVWTPEAVNPPLPFLAGYDEFIAVGLGPSNTVASTNIATSCGYCGNMVTTASTGKTVNLTNQVNFAANPPLKQGVGTQTVTNNLGFWALDQGGKSINSYGLKVDAQTASSQGGTAWALWTGATGPSNFGDYLQTHGHQMAFNAQTANYQMTVNDELVLVDATSGAKTITMPPLSNATVGAEYTIKKIDGTANVVTLASGSFIDFAASWPDMVSQFDAITVVQGSTQYYIKSVLAAGNCSANGSAANPSIVACGGASAGAVSCSVSASAGTCQINDTAVTAKSDITVTPVSGAWSSSRLGITCNTAPTAVPTVLVSAISAGVSFTLNMGTFSTNPACYMFHIDH